MGRFETGLIDRALAVLGEANARAPREPVRSPAVALALWALRPYCPRDWLDEFWRCAGHAEPIGRSQGVHAAFNGIELRARGRG